MSFHPTPSKPTVSAQVHRERQATADPTREVNLEGGGGFFLKRTKVVAWLSSCRNKVWFIWWFIRKYHWEVPCFNVFCFIMVAKIRVKIMVYLYTIWKLPINRYIINTPVTWWNPFLFSGPWHNLYQVPACARGIMLLGCQWKHI